MTVKNLACKFDCPRQGKIFNGHLKMNVVMKLDQDQTAIINNHRPKIQAYIMYITKLAAKTNLYSDRVTCTRKSSFCLETASALASLEHFNEVDY